MRMIFNQQGPAPAPGTFASRFPPRTRLLLNLFAIFTLISASTAAMMLCPCDLVSIHDHYSILLVAVAALFGIAAAWLIYRRMRRDSGTTAFLRACAAIAIVAVAVYAELFLTMQALAWMARPR
jgi:hypothetical protein